MAWLRLYDDILDDPKVQMLSDRAFRMFINCLALAKRNGGKLPGNMEVLAFSLRLPVGKVRDTFQALLSANLIDRDGDGFTPHNWHGRQHESDSAAERMRRYRERNKDKASDEQLRPPLRNSDVPDTDTDTDTEQKEVVERAARAAPAKGTRWPPDQVVSNEWVADADIQRHEHGLPRIDLRLEATRFANYWASKPGGNARKTDWHRTWINWALDDSKRRIGKVSAHDKGTEGLAIFLAKVERGDTTGHRDRTGEASSSPRLLEARHGPEEVGDAVRDLHRGSSGPERGATPSRLPSMEEQPREHEIPDAGTTPASVRPVQNILENATAHLVPRFTGGAH